MLGPTGIRPKVASQLIREFTYLHGPVSPKDGACCYLIMPAADTECFHIFLDALAKRFARQYILLFVDGAANHSGSNLVTPANIKLAFLPAYSPELNPQESLWDEIREKFSRTTPSNPWTRSMTSSRRPRSISSATQNLSNP